MPHGGKRIGAGRKPQPDTKRLRLTITLPQSVVAYLHTHPSGMQLSLARELEAIIRATDGFKCHAGRPLEEQ